MLNLLSIGIPTYNRAQYLCELLDSIVAQDRDDLEVVVSDDASPDDTEAAVSRYFGRIKNLKFIRQPVNLGVDRNFLAVIEAASGDYVWLMGDDDCLEDGGVQRAVDALARWPNVAGLTVGIIDYDRTMSRITGIRALPPTQRFEGAAAVFTNLADFLGLTSALIVRRNSWLKVAAQPETKAYENNYLQVYIIGQAVGKFGGWGAVKEPCVRYRSGNDQFEVKFGWVDRLKIDVVGYKQIADGLFGKDPAAYRAMLKRIFNVHVMARIVNAKASRSPSPGIILVAAMLLKSYYYMPELYLKALPILFAPKCVIRTARNLYKKYSASSGPNKAKQIEKISLRSE